MKISLSTPFLHQNRTTGSPSTSTLTCTQLCRLLCPPSRNSAASSFINSTTLILGYDCNSQCYDSDGWKEAGTVDVLREACSQWYYEESSPAERSIEGPISTRALSKLYHQHHHGSSSSSSNEQQVGIIAGNTRVYRNEQEGWVQIDQLKNLQLAMEAFREVVEIQMPSDWSTGAVGLNHSDGSQKQQRDEEDGAAILTTAGNNLKDGQNSLHANHQSQGGGNASNNSVAQMTFDEGDDAINQDVNNEILLQQQQQQNVADELEAFLSSTDHLAPHASNTTTSNDDDDDQEEYESDGGTRYIRDKSSGNWIHEALMMQQRGAAMNAGKNKVDCHQAAAAAAVPSSNNNNNSTMKVTNKKRKRNKPKFSAKSARNWIYVTGLPLDTTEEELGTYFSKVGIIDIDPESLKPKIKLYRHKKEDQSSNDRSSHNLGELKGDASICYARPESVELALQILDDSQFRDGAILSVQRAKFEQHGSTFDTGKSGGGGKGGKKRRIISESKRRVARLAAIQAVGWDESENGRIAGGLKGLRIIVLMNMFDPRELEQHGEDDENNDNDDDTNDTRLRALEREVHTECEKIGSVEKITIFSKHPAGVVIVKFVKPNDASDAVKSFNGMVRGDGRKVEASFWDGITDYTIADAENEEKEAEKRLDKFGDWLEEQELPEEFQLRVEGKD
ncbi:hypothetical protein ACHAWT_002122 [Skeletonema menzelii]